MRPKLSESRGTNTALQDAQGMRCNVKAGADGSGYADASVGRSCNGEAAPKGGGKIFIGMGHAIAVAHVVLGEAIGVDAGEGDAGLGGVDSEMIVDDGAGGGNGVCFGVRPAEEDEELSTLRFSSGVGQGVRVEEDSEQAVLIVMRVVVAGDEVAQAAIWVVQSFLGVEKIHGRDGDGFGICEGWECRRGNLVEVLGVDGGDDLVVADGRRRLGRRELE